MMTTMTRLKLAILLSDDLLINYGCLLSMLMTIVYDNWDTNHRLPKALPDMEIINGACIFH